MSIYYLSIIILSALIAFLISLLLNLRIMNRRQSDTPKHNAEQQDEINPPAPVTSGERAISPDAIKQDSVLGWIPDWHDRQFVEAYIENLKTQIAHLQYNSPGISCLTYSYSAPNDGTDLHLRSSMDEYDPIQIYDLVLEAFLRAGWDYGAYKYEIYAMAHFDLWRVSFSFGKQEDWEEWSAEYNDEGLYCVRWSEQVSQLW